MILGFLADSPLHGYELRQKMAQLNGHARTVSDGALYPAIRRLREAGHVTSTEEKGRAAAARRTLRLTDGGRARLLELLRGADGADVTDQSRFFVVLAFLSHLPEADARDAVLRRRLRFLEGARSFFTADGEPLRAARLTDPYRVGMMTIARATSRAEMAWLREQLGERRDEEQSQDPGPARESESR